MAPAMLVLGGQTLQNSSTVGDSINISTTELDPLHHHQQSNSSKLISRLLVSPTQI